MAGIDLATAYVNIVPSAKGIKGSISKVVGEEAEEAGDKAGSSVGNNLVSKLKQILVAAGIGAIIKQSLEAGGDLQQSFGGLDTLYGLAAEKAKEYAMAAAEAGISANNYSEQAVSFGASLKQAFGGDTYKAMEAANTAILDMADNSAKMGTDIESIQNAYQGFAKQNYTMLDNLKLGYGGTKTEMERLLKDAEKFSGVKYDIDNLGDVYQAIHVIQGELGLTGVAAEEASSTFTGSLGAMKANAENFLAALSTGMDIGPSLNSLIVSAETFLLKNLVPMVANIIKSIPSIIRESIPMILDEVDWLLDEAAANVGKGIPVFIDEIKNMMSELVKFIVQYAPEILELGSDLVVNLINGLVEEIPDLIVTALDLIDVLVDAIGSIDWVALGGQIIMSLLNGIGALIGKVPEIFQRAWDTIAKTAGNLWNIICNIFGALADFFGNIFGNAWQRVKDIFSVGGKIFDGIREGILNAFTAIVNAIIKGINKVVAIPFDGINWALQKIKDISIVGIKPFNWISTIPVPQIPYLEQGGILEKGQVGLLEGNGAEAVVPLEQNRKWISAVAADLKNALDTSSITYGKETRENFSQTINIYQPVKSPAETARAIKTTMKYGLAGA